MDWERERVDVVVDEVSMEPGLLRNTCSSGIRDRDMKEVLSSFLSLLWDGGGKKGARELGR